MSENKAKEIKTKLSMSLKLIDNDSLMNVLSFLSTSTIIGKFSLVSKEMHKVVFSGENFVWRDREVNCGRRGFDEGLYHFLSTVRAERVKIHSLAWLGPLMKLGHCKSICIASNEEFVDVTDTPMSFSSIEKLNVAESRAQISILSHILSQTTNVRELVIAPPRGSKWNSLTPLILQQKHLRCLNVHRVKVEKSFAVDIFANLPLERFTCDAISSEAWMAALRLPSALQRLKHLSITNMVRERYQDNEQYGRDSCLESLAFKASSEGLYELLCATSASMKSLDVTFIDSFQLVDTIYFPRLQKLKLTNATPSIVQKILSGCSQSLQYIELSCKSTRDAQLQDAVTLSIPNLKSITAVNIPQILLKQILTGSQVSSMVKLNVQFPPHEAHRVSLRKEMSHLKSVSQFDGEIQLFESLPATALSSLCQLKIRLPSIKGRLATNLGEDLMHKLESCERLTRLDLSVDHIFDPTTLSRLLNAHPSLSSLTLKGKYPELSQPLLAREYKQLQELSFDHSGLTASEMEQMLLCLPNLTRLIDAKPQPINKYFHLLGLLNHRGDSAPEIASIVGPSETEEVLQGVFLHGGTSAGALLLDSRLSFEEMIVTCICSMYHSTYAESCKYIDLLNSGNIDERESKLYYEARAISVYLDLVDQITNLSSKQRTEMKQSFDERGLPPCVKRLIELLAPAIC